METASWWQVVALSMVLNLATVVTSVALFRAIVAHRVVEQAVRPRTRRDQRLTASTTLVNGLVILPAWALWSHGRLELAPPSPWIVLEVAYLAVALDVGMYVLHRLCHVGVLYRWFHRLHHDEDRPPSELTLFTMHPVEASGFGLVVLVQMIAQPVSVPAVALFFGLNLIVGTVAHVPLADGATGSQWWGGSMLHQAHHKHTGANFGFFTQFWDRAFGTFSP